jgi:hypothetical protein
MSDIKPYPNPGSVWLHHTGREYGVISMANTAAVDDPRFPAMVVYVDRDLNVWTRPVSEWHDKFTFVAETKPEYGAPA